MIIHLKYVGTHFGEDDLGKRLCFFSQLVSDRGITSSKILINGQVSSHSLVGKTEGPTLRIPPWGGLAII